MGFSVDFCMLLRFVVYLIIAFRYESVQFLPTKADGPADPRGLELLGADQIVYSPYTYSQVFSCQLSSRRRPTIMAGQLMSIIGPGLLDDVGKADDHILE